MFYGVDLDRLRSIPGSKDLKIFDAVNAHKSNRLDDEHQDALKRIINGDVKTEPKPYVYGYTLKAICECIGELIGCDVPAIRDHPYKSKLVANGPPIEIPVDKTNFPEIGYLAKSDLEGELRLVTTTKPKAKRTLVGLVLRKATGGAFGHEPDAEEIAEEMAEYAETLQKCIDKGLSVVSFRH